MKCLNCNAELDMHTCAESLAKPPSEGDITFCFYCQTVFLFANSQGDIKIPSMAELADIMKSESWPLLQELRERAKKFFGNKFQGETKNRVRKFFEETLGNSGSDDS